MKKISAFVFSTAMMLLLCNPLKAQIRVTNYSQSNTIATVNGASIIVWSLYVLDSFDTQYNAYHTAVFEVNLGSDMVKKILNDLQSATQQKPLQELALVKLNMQAKPVEQRTYGSVAVKEISFSDLNADGKEPAKARITIQAQTVVISDNSSLTIAATSDKQKIPVNAFKLTIGSLPTQRVFRERRHGRPPSPIKTRKSLRTDGTEERHDHQPSFRVGFACPARRVARCVRAGAGDQRCPGFRHP